MNFVDYISNLVSENHSTKRNFQWGKLSSCCGVENLSWFWYTVLVLFLFGHGIVPLSAMSLICRHLTIHYCQVLKSFTPCLLLTSSPFIHLTTSSPC